MTSIDLVEFYYWCESVEIHDCLNDECPIVFYCQNMEYYDFTIHYAEGET